MGIGPNPQSPIPNNINSNLILYNIFFIKIKKENQNFYFIRKLSTNNLIINFNQEYENYKLFK